MNNNTLWNNIYTALACDIMDGMGFRDQALSHDLRPARDDNWFAGPAVTLDAHENDQPSDDPYGKIFAAYEQMQPGDVVEIELEDVGLLRNTIGEKGARPMKN